MDDRNPCDLELFPSLCNLASFVTNYKEMLRFTGDLHLADARVLASLIASGAEIERLTLNNSIPKGAGAELGDAIKRCGRINALSFDCSGLYYRSETELIRLVAVSASAALEYLKMKGLFVNEESTIRLCDSFGKFTELRKLVIENSYFIVPLLDKRISELRALESVHLSEIMFSGLDGTLVASLINLPTVTDINITCNAIGTENCRQIGRLVASGRVTKLTLNCDQITNEEISAVVDPTLASRWQRCSKLQKLSVRCHRLKSVGVRKVAELAAHSPYLRYLNLKKTTIDEAAAATLRKCVSSLEKLEISVCGLDPSETASLFGSPVCPVLATLKMGYNQAEDLGAMAIARFFLSSGGRTLTKLHMTQNNITEEGALALAKGLANTYMLRSIYMKENSIGSRGCTAILDALVTASTAMMDAINFEGCIIGDDGASAVGKLIMYRGCKSVNLNFNEIKDKGAEAIADCINPSAVCVIRDLYLSFNPIGDQGVEYLLNKIMQLNKYSGILCIR